MTHNQWRKFVNCHHFRPSMGQIARECTIDVVPMPIECGLCHEHLVSTRLYPTGTPAIVRDVAEDVK